MSTKKWSLWKWGPSAISATTEIVGTKDGRFLFLIGGRGDIRIIDRDSKQCVLSKFKFQDHSLLYHSHPTVAILRSERRDKVLTAGFVNRIFKTSEFKDVQLLPLYLIEMIGKWMSREYIHLLSQDSQRGVHYRVNVDDVLQSAMTTK